MKPLGLLPCAGLALMLAACTASAPGQHHADAAETAAATARESGQVSAGAANRDGTVVGVFQRAGGPIGAGGTQPPNRPLSGTVQFIAGRAYRFAVTVGHAGKFTVWLPAGSYRVSGSTPSIVAVLASGATRQTPCSQPQTIVVRPARTVRISVTCVVP